MTKIIFYVNPKNKGDDKTMNKVSLILVIIGAINWLLIGLFRFDLVGWIFGGQASVIARIVFTIVGLAGLWCISLLFNGRQAQAVD